MQCSLGEKLKKTFFYSSKIDQKSFSKSPSKNKCHSFFTHEPGLYRTLGKKEKQFTGALLGYYKEHFKNKWI